MTKYFQLSSKTVKQVLDSLTDNKDLKAVLAYSFGDYGQLACCHTCTKSCMNSIKFVQK